MPMKNADRAIVIGYSLPTDDVEIAMLFNAVWVIYQIENKSL